jgi:hypothetical protein
MDSEDSINAFAAGKTTSDAVIGVTRGCMKLLTRDELQGVIAHEFSHILNGDMKLNMRLIGMLFGILFLTLIGEMIIRGTYYSGRGSRNRDSGGAIIAIFVAGIGLIIIGYIGTFFANLIKASISRQREFLADASAVQFTRNPDGIAGALKKIGGLSEGSKIAHPMARDASHLFFGSAFSRSAFATHPPLPERIKRLIPHWNGDFGSARLAPVTGEQSPAPKKTRKEKIGIPGIPMLSGDHVEMHLSEPEAAESMRSVHVEQVNLGKEILDNMPPDWIEAAHSITGAQAITFALLLAQDKKLRERELSHIGKLIDPASYDQVIKLHSRISHLHSAVKLALIDLSIPSLRRLSPSEYDHFRIIVDGLVKSDKVVDLFEFTLQKIVARHLDTYFRITSPPRMKYRNFSALRTEAAVLMSTLSALSNPDDGSAVEAAFQKGSDHIEKLAGRPLDFQSAENCGLDAIRSAIGRFEQSSPIVKRELLLACSKVVLDDGKISSHEAELIRAIADAMGCAIPPFVRTAPLA